MAFPINTLTSVIGVHQLVTDHGETGRLCGTNSSFAEDSTGRVVLAVVFDIAVGSDEAFHTMAGGDVVHELTNTAVETVIGTDDRFTFLTHSIGRASADRYSILDLTETAVFAVLLFAEIYLAPFAGKSFWAEAVWSRLDIQDTCSIVLAFIPNTGMGCELEGGW